MTTELLTRAQLGLRDPKGPYQPLVAQGITLHYGGPSPWPTRNPADWNHDRCASIWRAWDDFHRSPGALGSPSGGITIAYTSGCCPHGVRLEGRGPGHRTAAQGTNDGNARSYAVVYIAGERDPLTDAAKLAFLDEQDRLGVAILWVHNFWHQTACAGAAVDGWKQQGCPRPFAPVPDPLPSPVLGPKLAVSESFTLEDLDMARLVVTEYPVPALSNGDGYWDLDGGPGRPLVAAGRCVSVMVNGADQPGAQAGEARPLKYGAFTRVRLFGFDKGATPTLVVASVAD